jgi:3-oxoacyl-[acyl-carrier protein] reductase
VLDLGGKVAIVTGGSRGISAVVEKVVVEATQRFGSPDILVNNAGVIEPIGPLVSSDPIAWRRNIEINLIGAYNAVRATLPRMLDASEGTIINVSSGAAHQPLEGWAAYCSGRRAWRC